MTAPISAPPSAPAPIPGSADKPSKVLPTDRVRFEKQMDLLRAYAAVSGSANRAVTVGEVANVAKLNGSTVSLCNGFFVDVGFLDRAPSGGFIPTNAVMQFQRAYAWNPDTAAEKLASKLAETWFMDRLRPKLAMGPLAVGEAVNDLADAASATKKYESQLYLLLDYLEAAGLIEREGDLIRTTIYVQDHPNARSNVPAEFPVASTQRDSSVRAGTASSSPASPSPTVPAAPVVEPGVNFTLTVNVSMAEIGTWAPARITAFFEGVAKALAAKNGAPQAGDTPTQ